MTSLRDFIPLQKLGEGTFSTVYKVKRISDGRIYALKKVRMNSLKDKERENAVNQIRILASLESPYVIGYKESIYDEKMNLLCIVMEYASGGDLQKKISEAQKQKALIVERQIWKAIVHVLRGLQTMHSKGILHRDLKSANIFLSDGSYKLGDLNVSKVNKGRLAYTQTGTPYYASPEVWRDEPYDSKSDIWSFGCIIYEMACLKPPFSGTDMESLYRNVQKCQYSRIPNCYSRDLQTIIGLCMQKNPKMRPSSTQLLCNPIVQKYADRLQVKDNPEVQEKKELLRTIKVPLGLKGLQKNLPKSKYEQEISPRLIDLPLPIQIPKPAELSPRLSPKLSPRSKVDNPIKKLLEVRSYEKQEPVRREEKLLGSDSKKDYSRRKEEEIKEIQRSLVIKQKQIEDYINSQLRRPQTSNKQPVRPSQGHYAEPRASRKRQDYSSHRKYPEQSYISVEKKKAQSQGNVSSSKKVEYEISRAREDYQTPYSKNISAYLNREYPNIQKNASSIIRQSNKMERRPMVRPESSKLRYNIMPSWWG